MGFMTGLKANKAYRAQQKGDKAEAVRLYEECFAEGLNDARYVLAYAILIIRDGQYQKAKDFLVSHQKAPGMTGEQRVTLIVDYAVCCFKLGDPDKAIAKLEEMFRKGATGLLYQTLGFMYADRYDASHREDFLAKRAAQAAAEQTADAQTQPAADDAGETPAVQTPEEQWEAGKKKALEFNLQAVDYDDEDSICLDNLAQVYYRVTEDRKEAKVWFDKAIAIKENQIDTLYFLSRYDLDAGDRAAALEKLEKAAEGRFSPLNFRTKEEIDREIAALKGDN